MALTNAYVLPTNRVVDILSKIRDGQAPERFTNQLLKDWGYTSTNDRAFIPLLKALGFLSAEGKPTQRYHDYRDHTRSKIVLGLAMREAYADIFLIKEHPTASDKTAIEGKFKSFHNVSDHVASLMTKTFMALLSQADLASKKVSAPHTEVDEPRAEKQQPVNAGSVGLPIQKSPSLHYNIQIHLPATKDLEVYNAIFKSLKEHLLQ